MAPTGQLIDARKDPVPHKSAGVNLLRGSATQVIDLLNELNYGENTPAELLEGREWGWHKTQLTERRNRR
ncbi:MAG: hypothetical protein IH586_23390 [Anaerolineaceae bacterium]|nr:hypothetical protein [Anaerolineaceae bacterium]